MAKSHTAASTPMDLSTLAMATFNANPLFSPQVRQFWEIQAKLLDEAEEFSRQWFARRREATRSAIAASEESTKTAYDPGGVLKSLNDWQTHSAERIAQDIQDWIRICSRCSGHLASGEVKANQEMLRKVTEEVAKNGTSHTTPV